MGFESGRQKTGGRQKGTPNKSSVTAREKIENLGFDPLEFMTQVAKDESADLSLRLNAAKEIASYCYPKLRSMEIQDGNSDSELAILEEHERIVEELNRQTEEYERKKQAGLAR